MPFIESFDKTKIYYKKISCKKPKGTMVFVHGGFFSNHSMLANLYKKFKDYKVIALDRRGMGDSDFPINLEDNKLEYHAKDINEILKKEKISKTIVVGVSFGGIVSLKFAEMFPSKIKKLVLVSSSYTTKKSKNGKSEKLVSIIKKIVNFLSKIPLKERREKSVDYSKIKKRFFHIKYSFYVIRDNSLKTILNRYKAAYDVLNYEVDKTVLKKINFPVLIVRGTKDVLFPFETQTELNEFIKPSQLKLIKNGRHNIHMHNSEEVVGLIKEFIN